MAPGRHAPRASHCYEFLIIFFPLLPRMAAICSYIGGSRNSFEDMTCACALCL